MAATVSKVKRINPASSLVTVTEVALDSSYQSGGEPLTAKQLGLRVCDYAVCTIIHGDEHKTSEVFSGQAYYTPSTGLIHVTNIKLGEETASTNNMEKLVISVLAFGR